MDEELLEELRTESITNTLPINDGGSADSGLEEGEEVEQ